MSRRSSSPIRILQLTAFAATLDRFAIPPLLVAIALDMDVPLSQVVNVAGIYFFAYGLSQPIWGWVSDQLGRVRTMRVTLLLAGILAVVSAFAWSPLSLGITRGLAGGFFGAAYPSSLIYIGDTVPASRRQPDIARLMVGIAAGAAFGSGGAGLLADLELWRLTFVFSGLLAITLAIALGRLPEPALVSRPRSPFKPLRAVARSPISLLVIMFAFVEGVALIGGLTLLPAAVESSGANSAVAGAVTASYGVAVLIASALVGRLAARWHPSWLIALGAGASAAGCALVAVSQGALAAIAVTMLFGLGWVSMHSSLQTWATEVLPTERATVVSLFAGSLFLGSAIAAVLVSDLVEDGRYTLIFGSFAVVAAVLGATATISRSRWHRPPDAPAGLDSPLPS